MWELHRILRYDKKPKQKRFLDAVAETLKGLDDSDFKQALSIMYPKLELSKENPVSISSKFIVALRKCDFFSFEEVINGFQ
jgi:hypothetical protein